MYIAGGILVGVIGGVTAIALGATGDDATAPPAGGDATPAATPTPQPPTPTPAPGETPAPVDEPADHAAAVVTAHELATEAGVDILEQGGTAADAAVAVAAALSIVEPWYSSALGGGTWALYYDAADDEVTALDGVGPTPSGATLADFAARAGEEGMHQATTPGAWDGWMLWLQEHGRLDLPDILEPAISIGREGYPMGAQMKMFLNRDPIMERPHTAAIYAPDGTPLQQGNTVYQHDQADTFEALAGAYDGALDDGRDAAIQAARDYFYRGPIAESLVAFSDEHGGYLTLEDFHGFEADIVDPISIDYNDDLTVFQNPPNSQGITQLIALNILKGFDFDGLSPNDPDAVHRQIEAVKLAFADRHHHVGDPARVDVPVEQLLSEEHAEAHRARIDIGSAMHWPIGDHLQLSQQGRGERGEVSVNPFGDTTTFHVVDSEGNGAAVTTSLGNQYLVAGDTGIHINNRNRFNALEDGNPNQFTPGGKVRHTSNPYLVQRNGELYILGANTGADTQSQAQVQQFMNVVEFGMSAQEAVDHPRWVSMAWPSTIYPHAAPNTLRMEGAFPGELVAALEARAHQVQRIEGETYGNASLIVLGDGGAHAETGAEPRNGTSSGQVIAPDP